MQNSIYSKVLALASSEGSVKVETFSKAMAVLSVVIRSTFDQLEKGV